MVDERFRASSRLRHNLEFERVFAQKRSVSNRWIIIYGCPNGLAYSRLGLTVSRRYGTAVARHRWKRWVREAFRRQQRQIPSGLDLIVLPRVGEPVGFHQVADGLPDLIHRLARRFPSPGTA